MLDDAQLAEILFAPLAINDVTLNNRIVMSPMPRRRIADPILRAGVSAPAAIVSIEPQEAA